MSRGFEGLYFKHQRDENTLALIVGRADDGAFIQAIAPEQSYRASYPRSAYRTGKTLAVSDSQFSKTGIFLSIREANWELTGHLYYHDETPIQGDIMGPFRFLPMQCRHTVVSMNHTLEGSLRLCGKEMDFTGGKGYIEGDSGRSFPKSYTWVQSNDFTENCSIMASAAHIPFGFSWFWGCICIVWLDGVEYRLATYRGAKIVKRDEKQLWLSQKDLSLKVFFLRPQAGHELDAPSKGRMKRVIREVPSAPAYFEFRKGDHILFQGESRFASYEHVV